MIELENVTIQRGGERLIQGANATFGSGQISLIQAENGLGKTTILNAMTGLIAIQEGHIRYTWEGHPLTKRTDIMQHLFYLPNDDILSPVVNGDMLLRLYRDLWHSSADTTEIEERLEVNNFIHKRIGKYSLGMQQMLRLSLYEVVQSSMWLMDEPGNGLDDSNTKLLQHSLLTARSQGKGIVLVTHSNYMLEEIADQRFTIRNRQLVRR